MLFKPLMHGSKKVSNNDALPEILSGGFQFLTRDSRKRYYGKSYEFLYGDFGYALITFNLNLQFS